MKRLYDHASEIFSQPQFARGIDFEGRNSVAEKIMNITHIGKIGRLPQSIRDDLGRRIEDGQPGKELVKWLNGLSDVQEVLKAQFGGRPITEQNISEWKQGGHQEWLRHEETRSLVSKLTEQSADLDEAADGQEISDRYAGLLAAKLVALTQKLLEEKTDAAQSWQFLREVLRELSQLRRDDHRALRTLIKRERWNLEVGREKEEILERANRENKKRLTDMCFATMKKHNLAARFGGGEHGEKMAELLHCIQFDLPLPDFIVSDLSGKPHPNGIKPNPTESNLIQPNPTKNCGAAPFPVEPSPAARS